MPHTLSRLMAALAVRLPEQMLVSLRQLAEKDPRLTAWRAAYNRDLVDASIISYPKSGRTWLRMMMTRAIQKEYDLPLTTNLTLTQFYRLRPGIPLVEISHDDDPHYKTPDELETDKAQYRNQKVLLLVRDPRDAIVSIYFQYTRRKDKIHAGDPEYQGSLQDFLDYERGSLATLLRFYQIWQKNQKVPKAMLLLSYEELHQNPLASLRRAFDFLGFPPLSAAALDFAVEEGAFENMRALEEARAGGPLLKPADTNDPESYKTRRGAVGGYVNYLSPTDTEKIESRLQAALGSFYAQPGVMGGLDA